MEIKKASTLAFLAIFQTSNIFCLLSASPDSHYSSLTQPFVSSSADSKETQKPSPTVDIVILYNGEQMYGKLENFPSLQYSFGKIDLDVEYISVIDFFKEKNELKVHIATTDGGDYVAAINSSAIHFLALHPDPATPTYLEKSIDPNLIQKLIIGKNKDSHDVLNLHLYTVEFKNGDQIPISPSEKNIRLSNGKQEFNLPISEIADITYNGGVQGVLIDPHGNLKELDFSLVKDKYFIFNLDRIQMSLKMPWNKIARIQGCHRCRCLVLGEDSKELSVSDSTDELIAFEPEAFSAFMQPFPLKEKIEKDNSGVSATYRRESSIQLKERLRIGTDSVFVFQAFDSPFEIAYDIQRFIAEADIGVQGQTEGDSEEFYADASQAGVGGKKSTGLFPLNEETFETIVFESNEQNFEFLFNLEALAMDEILLEMTTDENLEQVAMLSISETNKLNEEVLFDHLQVPPINPETFHYSNTQD